MSDPKDFRIEIPEQGVSEVLSKEDLIKFIDRELEFYNRVSSLVSGNIDLFGRNAGDPHLTEIASRHLQNLRKIPEDPTRHLEGYTSDARALRIVVGQGSIGKRVEKLIANGDSTDAKWLMYIFSKKWMNNGAEQLAPLRAAVIGHPATDGFLNVLAAEQAKKQALQTYTRIHDSEEHLNTFILEKTDLFSSLEEIYRRKLVFEEPALSWEAVSAKKTAAWRLWLSFFGLLIICPIVAIAFDWNDLSAKIVHLTTTSAGAISIAGVATITLPTLLYAWLLKNVSRVFLQNLNLADDASHRRMLALTYLGLAENPKLKIDDSERALILNALFRPVSSSADDDGPPMGLIDLIRHKP